MPLADVGEVYLKKGEEISGSSVAAVYGIHLLMGDGLPKADAINNINGFGFLLSL